MIPAIEKLIEVAASGVGGVAGTFLASWKARKEGEARVIAAKADAEILMIRTEAHAKARELLLADNAVVGGEIDLANRANERIAYQEKKRLTNIGRVVGEAALALEHKEVPATEPDHDWAARFFNEVQDVSSEEMQTLWARVLAGEVERPGSTSIRTLGVLRDLDQATAKLFATFCSACMFVLPEAGRGMSDARVVSLGGNAGDNSLKDFGFPFAALNRLHEHGLIISDYNSWSDLSLCVAPQYVEGRKPVTVPFHYQGELWVLVPESHRNPDAKFKVHGVALSLGGRELSRLVDQEPVSNYTELFSKFFLKNKFRMLTLNEWAVRKRDLREFCLKGTGPVGHEDICQDHRATDRHHHG